MRVAHRCKNEFLPTIALPNRSASLPGAFLSSVIPAKDDPATFSPVIPAKAGIQQRPQGLSLRESQPLAELASLRRAEAKRLASAHSASALLSPPVAGLRPAAGSAPM
jgi:hypothetical protein